MLDTGLRSVTVDASNLPTNPLDDEGYQRIQVGDRVRVFGSMDYDFFTGRTFNADLVTTVKSGSSQKDNR